MRPTPQSTSIAAIGYDGAALELWVTFEDSSATYVYAGVPVSVWIGLQRAESKGRFVNVEVKPRYSYREA